MSKPDHPYREYQGTPLWSVVQKALRDLTNNGDLDLQTAEAYVVGYLVKTIDDASFR